VVILGGAAILIVLILVAAATILRINRPLDRLLGGITSLAKGQKDYQIAITSDDEIGRVGRAFNEMARTLQVANETREAAERELEEANAKLLRRSAQLQERGHAIDLLGKMAHRLQAVTNDAEFAEIVQCFAPQILPGVAGALYLLNNSRSLMTLAAPWGDGAADVAAYFGPQECWALRRGQIHEVIGGGDVRCQHAGDDDTPYICLPLLAHGDTVGLLYLEGVTQANLARLPLLAENIALALANHRLQQSLREQSIRDPLTGLFNRRYLEESLTLELARASRGNTSVGLMMLDIDHFKRFNDTFGHETGDTLLRAVGQVLPAHVRAGDILCRYGGEEFTIILPGAGLELTRQRAEAIRQAVADLVVRHQGQSVGQITMSIGVSARPTHGTAPEALLMAADAALYRAKGAGRNRVEMAVEANMEA
jgi:diguanylate cyclase (GGDEF)-like protein